MNIAMMRLSIRVDPKNRNNVYRISEMILSELSDAVVMS